MKQKKDEVFVKTVVELDPNKHYMVECRINAKGVSREALWTALKSLKDCFKKAGVNNVVFVPVGDSELIESVLVKEFSVD